MCVWYKQKSRANSEDFPRKPPSSRVGAVTHPFHPVVPPATDKWTHTAELGGLRPRRERGPIRAQQANLILLESSAATASLLKWKESARPPPAGFVRCSASVSVWPRRARGWLLASQPRPRFQSVAQCVRRDKSPGFTRLFIYPSIYIYPGTGV